MPEYDARVGRTATQLHSHAVKDTRPMQRIEVEGDLLPRCPKQSADGRLVCCLDKGHPESEVHQFRLRELAEQIHARPRYSYAPATAAATNGNGKAH